MEIAQHPQCGEIRFPVITCGQISIQCVHWVIVHAISYFNGIKAVMEYFIIFHRYNLGTPVFTVNKRADMSE